MPKGNAVTVTMRKCTTGHKVCAFAMDSLDHAYSIAKVLVRSSEYGRCFAVGLDWAGEHLFSVQPNQVQDTPAPYYAPQAPVPQQAYYPPQPQLPQAYAPQYAPQGYPQQYVQSHVPVRAQVIDAYVEPDPFRPALPAYVGQR